MELEDFKTHLTELRTMIIDVEAYFSSWYTITNLDESAAQALSRYRGFFKPAQLALKDTALLQLAKIFDRDRRTVSLRNILLAVKENHEVLVPHATEDALKEMEIKFDENEELLNNLKSYRDQRLAHYDSELSRDTTLTYGQVKQLIEDLKSIFDTLTLGHERSTTSFDWISRQAEDHTAEVIRIMKEEKDRAQQKISEFRIHTEIDE